VDAARGRSVGERVLVLVRPEVLEVSPAENGGALAGEVVSHTFLGSVTRVKVAVGEGELTADVPTVRVDSLPVGARVTASFPPSGARLLDLSADEPPHELDVEA
jgi:putative spermidine/putrescine transport system ATP-binding protein